MIQILLIFIILICLSMATINHYKGEFTLAIIKGLMIGFLYNDDEGKYDTEHTIKILFLVFSFNFIWITKNK